VTLVSRVQFAVRSAGAGDTVRIPTRAPGYLLEADPGAVDASRFKRLVHVARARTRCQQKPRTYSTGHWAKRSPQPPPDRGARGTAGSTR
jgi:hypothetical protein